MPEEFFWMLVILLGFIGPLVIGAIFVEEIAPRSRKWIKRVERIHRGRLAQQANYIKTSSFYGKREWQ
jgi:hypothetical protein